MQHAPCVDTPTSLSLPPEIFTEHVWQHLSPWARLQLRRTCKHLFSEADHLLQQAHPHIDIHLDLPPFQQTSELPDTVCAVNEDGLRAVAKLVDRMPRTNSLDIGLHGGVRQVSSHALNWPQLPQITQLNIEAEYVQDGELNQAEHAPHLLAAVTTACPNLQELTGLHRACCLWSALDPCTGLTASLPPHPATRHQQWL